MSSAISMKIHAFSQKKRESFSIIPSPIRNKLDEPKYSIEKKVKRLSIPKRDRMQTICAFALYMPSCHL